MTAFRIVRDIIVILACLCVIGVTAEIVIIQARIASTISQLEQGTDPGPVPDPTATGCPFGPDACGG